MDEASRKRRRDRAREILGDETVSQMSDDAIRKIDRILDISERVEAIESKREAPIWQKPLELIKAIGVALTAFSMLVGVIYSFAEIRSDVESVRGTVVDVRKDVDGLETRVTANRIEMREEVARLDAKATRSFEIVNEKLDRLIFHVVEGGP